MLQSSETNLITVISISQYPFLSTVDTVKHYGTLLQFKLLNIPACR